LDDPKISLSVLCCGEAARLKDRSPCDNRPHVVDRIVGPSQSHVDAVAFTGGDTMSPPDKQSTEDESIESPMVVESVREVVSLTDVPRDCRRPAQAAGAINNNMVHLALDLVDEVDDLVGLFFRE
jgi:hypothetical protein